MLSNWLPLVRCGRLDEIAAVETKIKGSIGRPLPLPFAFRFYPALSHYSTKAATLSIGFRFRIRWLQSHLSVDRTRHLWMASAANGAFRSMEPTEHTRTRCGEIAAFGRSRVKNPG